MLFLFLMALSPDNVSARIPNGVECYSCVGDNCPLDSSAIVKCYDNFRGCFHGNVTMKAGETSGGHQKPWIIWLSWGFEQLLHAHK